MQNPIMEEKINTLTKKDVARRVSDLMDEPIYKSEPWVNAVITAIGELMVEADPEVRIELRDFGVFEVKKTKAKPKARNPKTNETVFIPSRILKMIRTLSDFSDWKQPEMLWSWQNVNRVWLRLSP